MIEVTNLAASARNRAGKGAARATRREGMVPGVIYGDKKSPSLLAIDPRIIHAQMRKAGFYTRIFDISVDGGKAERVMVRDVQLHPVSDQPLHIDFMRINANMVLKIDVPVRFLNEDKCPGIKNGGLLNVISHSVEVECRPDRIPSEFTIDLANLNIADTVHIAALTMPEGVKPVIGHHETAIVSITAPAGGSDDTDADASAEG